eukprot:SAG31_NODE_322_length_17726_cov_18.070006_3_plen_40_part_00
MFSSVANAEVLVGSNGEQTLVQRNACGSQAFVAATSAVA